MVLSKFDLAIVAVVAVGMLWIEHGHRIQIVTPTAAEVAKPAASVCPDDDTVPFSADCIAFIRRGVSSDKRSRVSATGDAPSAPDAHRRADLHAPACPPSNENGPYSANCLSFLSGWYWHPTPADRAP